MNSNALGGYSVTKLGNLLELLTDYHANGAYKELKANVELLDKPDYAVMIRTTNFEQLHFEINLKFINKKAYNFLAKSKVNPGDLIMNKIANAGSTYLMPNLNRPVSLAMNLFLLRVDKLKANPVFVYLYLKINEQYVKSFANGSVTKTITKDAVKNLEIYLPNRHTQDEIANFYISLSSRINLLKETNTTLEVITQALFKSWFVDFDPVRAKAEGKVPEGIDEATASLFPDAFEEGEPRLFPKGWSVTTLATIASFQNGYAFKGSDWSENGHPVIKIGNVKPLLVDFECCSYVSPPTVIGLERFRLSAGDLLVGMTGYVGETGLVPHNETASYLNQRVGHITTKNGLQDLGFVFSAVRQKEFKTYAESQSYGSAQPNVSGADLMKFALTVPSVDILKKYNEVMHQFITSILKNHHEATLLTNLRDTLLPRLISGKIRLPDLKETNSQTKVNA